MEEEEQRQGDVICVTAVAGHLKQGRCVTAAAFVVIWKKREPETAAGEEEIQQYGYGINC